MTASIKTLQVSVTTGAAPLLSGGKQGRAGGGIIVKALSTNGAIVYIGGTVGVTSATGYPLAAGESVSLNVDDPGGVYAVAASGTQALALLYV